MNAVNESEEEIILVDREARETAFELINMSIIRDIDYANI